MSVLGWVGAAVCYYAPGRGLIVSGGVSFSGTRSLSSFEERDSVDLDAIYLYAGVRADPGAGTASRAVIGIGHKRIVVAAVVYLVGLECQSVGRTCNHTQVASFASLDIDRYSSFYFCHIC